MGIRRRVHVKWRIFAVQQAQYQPAQAWLPVAPTHTPPTHTRSHHPRWSSSGSQPTSSPSFRRHGAPSPGREERDAPLFHRAPGSSRAGAADKKGGFRNHIYRTCLSFFKLLFQSLLCLLDIFFNYNLNPGLLPLCFLPPIGQPHADVGFFVLL